MYPSTITGIKCKPSMQSSLPHSNPTSPRQDRILNSGPPNHTNQDAGFVERRDTLLDPALTVTIYLALLVEEQVTNLVCAPEASLKVSKRMAKNWGPIQFH